MKTQITSTLFTAAIAGGFLVIALQSGCSKTSAGMQSAADKTMTTATGAVGAAKDATTTAAKDTMGAATEMAKDMGAMTYYAEETKEGRIIVFGSKEAHEEFKTQGRVPEIRRTLIGGGPNGETVYIEADKKGDMADRLHATFKAKHGTM